MIDWLVGVLSPTFENMGASTTDIQKYATELAPQIYAILGIVAVVILAMILVHFLVRRGSRAMVRGIVALFGLLGLVIVVNTIAFGSGLHDNIANIMNNLGKGVGEASANSVEVQNKIGDEGIVLAENDDLLPLPENTKINLFGWSSVYPIFGGTGSGSSDTSTAVDIIQSLKDAGFEVNQSLIDFYKAYKDGRGGSALSISYTDWSLPEPPVDTYGDSLINEAKDFSDTAIIVIARSGGEGQDEPLDMGAVIDGSWNEDHLKDANGNENYAYFASSYENNSDKYDDFEKGEHYLELSKTERDLVEMVTSNFANVIVVVNANNAMELGWTKDYESIKGVLLAPGTGQAAMSGLGRILNGSVNPSGRTVDTYVSDLTKTPTYNNFGSFVYDNVDDLQKAYTEGDPNYEGVISFVNYVEGIYVGYKYYETADVEGAIDYDAEVVYPFGYGLSYTTFEQSMDLKDNGDAITVAVTVKNTGDRAGKDVVELYYTAPYTNGGIEKSAVNLLDFDKTKLLEPGEEQTIEFTINKEDMASYDSEGIKVDGGGYILEAGEYVISARANSHEVLAEATFKVDKDIDYSKDGRSTDEVAAVNQLNDFSKGEVTYLSRKDGFKNYDEATAAPTNYSASSETKAVIDEFSTTNYDATKYDNASDELPKVKQDNGISLSDMVGADYGDERWELLLDEMKLTELKDIVLGGFFSTAEVGTIGKVKTTDSDGPTGLNNWAAGVYGTPFPAEVLLAQTWNKELAFEVGTAMAAEYVATGTFGWYGPAMNTHRSAFGGRNFEYYSEDGVLAGKIAAEVVDAAAEQGIYAYIKHFALNDQETNRCGMLNTFATEQAIREIYLKPFEFVVKSQPKTQAVMSSFNYIGTRYAGACSPLLNNILRDEWGFKGMVLTDWYGRYGYMNPQDILLNGGSLMLNVAEPNDISNDRSATMLQAMRKAAKDICYTVVNSAAYTSGSTSEGGLDQMTMIFIGIDVAALVIAVGGSALIVWQHGKNKKKAAA